MASHVLTGGGFSLLTKRLMAVFNYCRHEHPKVEFPTGGLSQTE